MSKMKFPFSSNSALLKKISTYGLSVMLFVGLIAFAEKKQASSTCEELVIHLKGSVQARFVTENQVRKEITKEGNEPLEGQPLDRIDIKKLEQELSADPFIGKAEVSYDIKGNLIVDVWQEEPIARIFLPSTEDMYISHSGEILPFSKHYTARVLLVEPYSKVQLEDTALRRQVIELCQFIDGDPFWKAQIAQMLITKNKEVKLFPQIGKQVIEFGRFERIPAKFKKLKTFYEDIIPFKGYNHYRKINLAFEDQIVCE